MKKLLAVFALMGIVSSAHAVGADSATGCFNKYINDVNVHKYLNEGDQYFFGLKKLVSGYTDMNEQVERIIEAESNEGQLFANAVFANMLAYVAVNCPDEFRSFASLSEKDDASGSYFKLKLPYVYEDGTIKIVEPSKYNTADEDKRGVLAVSMKNLSEMLKSEYVLLLLPGKIAQDIKIGNWMQYDNMGLGSSRISKRQWRTKYGDINSGMLDAATAMMVNDGDIAPISWGIDGLDFININQSFPGLLVNYDESNFRAGYKSDAGLPFLQNTAPYKFTTLKAAIDGAHKLSQSLYSENTEANRDSYEIIVASADDPISIAYRVIEKRAKEKGAQKNVYQGDNIGILVASILAGVATMFVQGSWKLLIGALALGGVIFVAYRDDSFMGMAEFLTEEIDVTTIERLYVMDKIPVNNVGRKWNKVSDIEHEYIEAPVVTAVNKGGSAPSGGNAGTPAKSGDKKVITNEFVF